jgi:hypothetical protein
VPRKRATRPTVAVTTEHRSGRFRLPSEPVEDGAQGKIEPALDYLGGGKPARIIVAPTPQGHCADAQLGTQLRPRNKIARVRRRYIHDIQARRRALDLGLRLSHLPPRNDSTVGETVTRLSAIDICVAHEKTYAKDRCSRRNVCNALIGRF